MRTLLLILLLAASPLVAQSQSFEWLTIAGGVKSDKGTTIAVDDDGYTYITGYYNEEADFGPFTTGFSFQSSKEVYVAKIDPAGNYVWVKNGLNYYDDRGLGLCLDPDGNVYVTGTCWGGLTFGTLSVYNSSSYTDQIYVIKLDNNGNEQWMKNAGVNEAGYPYNDDHGQDLISDSQGNIYLTGFISNNDPVPHDATFDAISIPVAPFDSLAYIAKLSNDGTWQWVQTFEGIYAHRDNAIAVDDEDNIYVTGAFVETKTFGTSTITSSGKQDIYVVKYDSDGNFQWVQQAGSTYSDRGNAITNGNDGYMYVTGEFRDSCYFGTMMLNNYGGPKGRDIFVARISKDGEWQWVNKAGSKKGSDRGNGIAANDQGNIFVTGQYSSNAKFGTLTLDSSGDSVQVFIAAIDTLGVWRWVLDGGGYDFDRGNSIVVDNNCNTYVTGYFADSIQFGELSNFPNKGKDIFTVKVADACFGYDPPEEEDPVKNEMCTLITSNVITPNDDGINDVVFFTVDCNIPVDIVIVNRWGNIVFRTSDPGIAWNGTDKNGTPVAEGVYFYRVNTNFTLLPDEETSGFIHVIR